MTVVVLWGPVHRHRATVDPSHQGGEGVAGTPGVSTRRCSSARIRFIVLYGTSYTSGPPPPPTHKHTPPPSPPPPPPLSTTTTKRFSQGDFVWSHFQRNFSGWPWLIATMAASGVPGVAGSDGCAPCCVMSGRRSQGPWQLAAALHRSRDVMWGLCSTTPHGDRRPPTQARARASGVVRGASVPRLWCAVGGHAGSLNSSTQRFLTSLMAEAKMTMEAKQRKKKEAQEEQEKADKEAEELQVLTRTPVSQLAPPQWQRVVDLRAAEAKRRKKKKRRRRSRRRRCLLSCSS